MVLEQMIEHETLYDPPAAPALSPQFGPLAPGAELGQLVTEVDSSSLSRYERVRLICAYQKLVSH